jgi:hypothetical protein
MALSGKKNKWMVAAGVVVIVLLTGILFMNTFLSRKADSLLREKLSTIDTVSYHIDYKKVRVNLFSMSVRIEGISIHPADAAMEQARRSRLAAPVVALSIERICIRGINPFKAFGGDDIHIGSITLGRPVVEIYSLTGPFDILEHRDTGAMDHESGDIPKMTLGSFRIDDAGIIYHDLQEGKPVLETQGLDLMLSKLQVHPASGENPAGFISLDAFYLSLALHRMDLPGNFYSIRCGPAVIDHKKASAVIDSLRLIPLYEKNSFGKAAGRQTDRFDLTVGKIGFEDIVFDSLSAGKLIAGQLMVNNPAADIYRDKRMPLDKEHFPKLLQTAIAGMPLQVNIARVKVVNGKLAYGEIVQGASGPGQLTFTALDVLATGICNDPDSISKGQSMIVDAKGLLMGISEARLHLRLPVGDPHERFSFYGSLTGMPAEALNPLITPLASLEAKSGNINSLEYFGIARSDTAIGRLQFLYQVLDMSMLKKSGEDGEPAHENKLLSFLARTVIQKNNPHPGKDAQTAYMFFERDLNKGFFNFLWKSIQSGIMQTLLPGRKSMDTEMPWPEFVTDWPTVLAGDWQYLRSQQKPEKGQEEGKDHKKEHEHKHKKKRK